MTKEEILKAYAKLAGKLGKLPSSRELIKYVCSERQVNNSFKGFTDLKKQALKQFPYLMDLEVPAKLTQIDVIDHRLAQQKKQTEKENKDSILRVSTLEYVAQFADKVFSGKITPNSIPKKKKPASRALNLTLSDLHFGSDILAQETGHLNYGTKEEARRLATIVEQVALYKPEYRDVTELHVNLLGDLINGKLHDVQDNAALSEQICRAIHLLSQALAHLAENFHTVKVHCATGNHSRIKDRHHGRATSSKWDSYETVIYYALKKALLKYKNIDFQIPKTPFTTYEVLGHKVFTTHGCTVLNVGNPGKALNISSIENQLNKINATLNDTHEFKVAIVGHTHCSSSSLMTNGTHLITNGALCPPDQFATSIGILEGVSSQTLFEMVKEHAVGDLRVIRVGANEDQDSSLDKIIKPWVGFED